MPVDQKRLTRLEEWDSLIEVEELGQRIGQHQVFISKVELGARHVDVMEFAELCGALELDYDLLPKTAVKD